MRWRCSSADELCAVFLRHHQAFECRGQPTWRFILNRRTSLANYWTSNIVAIWLLLYTEWNKPWYFAPESCCQHPCTHLCTFSAPLMIVSQWIALKCGGCSSCTGLCRGKNIRKLFACLPAAQHGFGMNSFSQWRWEGGGGNISNILETISSWRLTFDLKYGLYGNASAFPTF